MLDNGFTTSEKQQIRRAATIGGGVLFITLALSFCCVLIKPGYVGVVVNLLGDKKGVDDRELTVGAHLIPPWKSVYRFPVYEQNYCWEGGKCFQFQTSDGMSVTADIGITYRLKPDCVHEIFCRYRRGIDEITNVFLRNYIRDAINKAASHYRIEDLYSKSKEKFFDDLQSYVSNTLESIGIDVSRIYLIGKFHLPEQVVVALNRKIEAMQRAEQRENELREAEAEAKKVVAAAKGRGESRLIEARAIAESNNLIAESMTDRIIMQNMVDRWDGVLPRIMSGDALSLLQPAIE